ncbi:MAG: SDR family oxidoreductase, partial [Acidimicrobiia bacterium]|nr:SDR family oxidoreductase [Acidimicrobiia bacterium]
MNVNVRGVFNCCRAAVRQMATQPSGGSIINIGSIAGNVADHQMAVYNASKGAVHALTRAIATDNGRQGVRCN